MRRVDTGDDIEDPSHYIVEDAKQKAEHDRKLEAAETKKLNVGSAITVHTHRGMERHEEGHTQIDAHKDKERGREEEGGRG